MQCDGFKKKKHEKLSGVKVFVLREAYISATQEVRKQHGGTF
jgi:hypothetical protein